MRTNERKVDMRYIDVGVIDYEGNSQLRLFTRNLFGYEHILTNTFYPKSSKETGNKSVIRPNSMIPFIKKYREIASRLFEKYGSYDVDISVIGKLEQVINDNEKFAMLKNTLNKSGFECFMDYMV